MKKKIFRQLHYFIIITSVTDENFFLKMIEFQRTQAGV